MSQQNENRVTKGDNASGRNNRAICVCPENHDETKTDAAVFSKFNQIREPSYAKKKMMPKRKMKRVLTARNGGQSSRVIRNDSDIVFLWFI